ncbi:M23 family metallopeptidase [Rubrivivax albus]|uniref:M23 family metallopeptidase n=1 Tax=Rubrivivax albus TaxID=2499835 RepID=A0A437JT63_9BURK|nr:M23 family metallopeptidase [Rubrivivax albus]RVT50376.1 M23 family metallopeptidase [Rubrivivax albus]
MQDFERQVTTAALFVLAALGLWLVTALWRLKRLHRRGRLDAPTDTRPHPGLRLLRALGSLGLVGLAIGLADAWLSSLRGALFLSMSLKIALTATLVVCVALEVTLRARAHARPGAWPWIRSGVAALVFLAATVVLALRHQALHAHPPASADTLLAAPFAGRWVSTGAGPTAASNHHHRIASQRHAADIVRLCDDGRLYHGNGTAPADSCTWGAEVLAPIDGRVVQAVDGLPDQGSRSTLAGNHVVIRLDDQRYVALAHLKQGSVRVAVGDTVRCGQFIALAGASGNTDFPHLHVHVQDSASYDLHTSRSIPFRFRDVELRRHLWWQRVDSIDLIANDTVRADGTCPGVR